MNGVAYERNKNINCKRVKFIIKPDKLSKLSNRPNPQIMVIYSILYMYIKLYIIRLAEELNTDFIFTSSLSDHCAIGILVTFSTFLQNHWASFNQTCQKAFLVGKGVFLMMS